MVAEASLFAKEASENTLSQSGVHFQAEGCGRENGAQDNHFWASGGKPAAWGWDTLG